MNVGVIPKEGRRQQLKLITVPFICQPLATQLLHAYASKYPHLTDLDLADSSTSDGTADIDLLIGSDYYWDFVTGRVKRGDTGPVAIHTTFGWILSGTTPTPTDVEIPSSFLITHTFRTDAENLDETLRAFWDLETLGLRSDEQSVLEDFSQKIQVKEGHYEVRLLWKDPHSPLPTNYDLSLKRLVGLLRQLKERSRVLQEYSNTIQSQLEHCKKYSSECHSKY